MPAKELNLEATAESQSSTTSERLLEEVDFSEFRSQKGEGVGSPEQSGEGDSENPPARELAISGGEASQKAQAGAAKQSQDLKALFDKNFDKLDLDHNGFVSESEIDKAMGDDSFKDEDAQMVAALKSQRKNIEELANDEWGDENDGISKNDIAAFDALQDSNASELTALGLNDFDQIDSNKNGHLSYDEITARLADPSLPERQRKVLDTMRSKIADIEECSNDEWGDENDGITRSDLQKYSSQAAETDEYKLVAAVNHVMNHTRIESQKASRRLFDNEQDPLKSIRPEAVRQGSEIGDCYFMSAVASLAATNPQAIKDMIKDNGDGTYTVTFPGAKDEPITVKGPTDQELGRYAGGSEHGTWAAVLEKAYGTYCNTHFYRRSPDNIGGGGVAAEGAEGGSALHDGLKILTGRGVDVDQNSLSSQQSMHEKLTKAFAEKRPVNAFVDGEWGYDYGLSDGMSDENPDIDAGHEYSVLAYDPDKRLVTIRNPYGRGEPKNADGTAKDGKNDGIYTMPLEEFKRTFSGVAYSK